MLRQRQIARRIGRPLRQCPCVADISTVSQHRYRPRRTRVTEVSLASLLLPPLPRRGAQMSGRVGCKYFCTCNNLVGCRGGVLDVSTQLAFQRNIYRYQPTRRSNDQPLRPFRSVFVQLPDRRHRCWVCTCRHRQPGKRDRSRQKQLPPRRTRRSHQPDLFGDEGPKLAQPVWRAKLPDRGVAWLACTRGSAIGAIQKSIEIDLIQEIQRRSHSPWPADRRQ